eukprot:Gb_24938 [translate_table: standard]
MQLLFSVSVVGRFVRPLNRHIDVSCLIWGKFCKPGTQLGQVQSSHLLIQMFRQYIYLLLILARLSLVPELQLSNYLVCEGAGHDKTWVASSTTQVHKTALCQNNDTRVGLREHPAICLRLDGNLLHSRACFKAKHVNLVVKVTNVAHNGIVLHLLHVIHHDNVLVTSGGHKDIRSAHHILEGENWKTLHKGLQGTDWVNLSNYDSCSCNLEGCCTTLPNISISTNNSHLTSNHHICGSHQTIWQRMSASVQVIKLALGNRVIHIDSREQQRSISLHLI